MPRLATKVAKPALIKSVKTKRRPSPLLAVLYTARAKLQLLSVAQIKSQPLVLAEMVARVQMAVRDQLGGEPVVAGPELGGDFAGVLGTASAEERGERCAVGRKCAVCH